MIQIDAMLLKIKNIKNIIPQIFRGSLSPPPMNVSIRKENQIIHIHRKHKEKTIQSV